MVDTDAATNGMSLLFLEQFISKTRNSDNQQNIQAKGVFESGSATSIEVDRNLDFVPTAYVMQQTEETPLDVFEESLDKLLANQRPNYDYILVDAQAGTDIYALAADSDRLARIEVKTTQQGSRKWVLGKRVIDRKNWSDNVFWVLVMLPDPHPPIAGTTDEIRGRHAPRFFVFGSGEIGEHVLELHEEYARKFKERHGREFKGPGVIQLPTSDAEDSENRWDKVGAYFQLNG